MTEWLGNFLGNNTASNHWSQEFEARKSDFHVPFFFFFFPMCISKHCVHCLLHWLLCLSSEVTSVECIEILSVTQEMFNKW